MWHRPPAVPHVLLPAPGAHLPARLLRLQAFLLRLPWMPIGHCTALCCSCLACLSGGHGPCSVSGLRARLSTRIAPATRLQRATMSRAAPSPPCPGLARLRVTLKLLLPALSPRSWCGCNNSALMAELVPEQKRSSIFAFDRRFEVRWKLPSMRSIICECMGVQYQAPRRKPSLRVPRCGLRLDHARIIGGLSIAGCCRCNGRPAGGPHSRAPVWLPWRAHRQRGRGPW